MTRLTIDITGEEKQKIKMLAALHGKTLKDFVLARVLPDEQESQEINALLHQALQENSYSDWTGNEIDDIRRKFQN